ncbi:DUF29 domain-containing protein [Candidatus Magnetomoraceae bacterium gMMP-15]
MEELYELKAHIEHGRYPEALFVIGEMEEMSRDDKINRVRSHTVILLLHLIKQHAEQRSTRSWEFSIYNALEDITYINKRRKSGGYYLKKDELEIAIEEAWDRALKYASLEAFEGRYSEAELMQMINAEQIKNEALQKILQRQDTMQRKRTKH